MRDTYTLEADLVLIGYARVSTSDQNLDMQHRALSAAGCKQIFEDVVSGGAVIKPGLIAARHFMREGDVLVVWRLDRLTRRLDELISLSQELQAKGQQFRSITEGIDTTTPAGTLFFHIAGAFAQFERDVIRERTLEGLTAAKARGSKSGPKERITDEQWRLVSPQLTSGALSVVDSALLLKVDRATVYRRQQRERQSATTVAAE